MTALTAPQKWPQMSRAAAESLALHEFGILYDDFNGEPARPATEEERERARESMARYGDHPAITVRGRRYTWQADGPITSQWPTRGEGGAP